MKHLIYNALRRTAMPVAFYIVGSTLWAAAHPASAQSAKGSSHASSAMAADGAAEPLECRYEYPEKLADSAANVASPPVATTADPDCAISAADAHRQWQSKARLIVDTRRSAEWALLHIPGSLNMSPNEIRTKAFLKGRPIALIDKGENQYALGVTCAGLKQAGFADVKVVAGGFSVWRRIAPLEGPMAKRGTDTLTANEFFSTQRRNAWLIVAVGFDPSEYVEVFGKTRVVRYDGDDKRIVAALQTEVEAWDRSRGLAVLFVDAHETFSLSEGILAKFDKQVPVFVLERGLAALLEEARTRSRLVARVNQPPTPVKRCGR